MTRWHRVVRASLIIYIAAGLLLLLAGLVNAQCTKETSGVHWWPGRARTGPTTCDQLDTSPSCGHEPGVWVFCKDCLPTCPASCDFDPNPLGAHCFRDRLFWSCFNSTGFCTNLTTTTVTTTSITGTTETATTITATTITATTATTVSTTTATTTTSVTTTTTPSQITNNFLWIPSHAPFATSLEAYVPNTLFCNAFIPEIGILNATSLTFQAGAAGNCGVAIYSADGTSRITTTGGLPCGTTTATSSAFTLVAGTMYQLCSCGDSTPLYVTTNQGTGNGLRSIENAFSTTKMNTTGTNTCTGGSPPTTTGVLNTNVGGRSAIVVLLGTNTP